MLPPSMLTTTDGNWKDSLRVADQITGHYAASAMLLPAPYPLGLTA